MSKRNVNILSESEIADIYDIPEFNEHEQMLYFALDPDEKKLADKFKTTNTKLYCILQIGYFRAKNMFFKFRFEDVKADVKFVYDKFCDGECPSVGAISRERIDLQKEEILKKYDYQQCTGDAMAAVKSHFSMLIKYFPKPHNAARELLKYCDDNKIIMPAYRKLQDIYSESYNNELARLSVLLDSVPQDIKLQLDSLIKKDDGILSLNDIRYDQRDFSYTAIKSIVEKVNELAEIYQFCKHYLPLFDLSQNAIRYYSEIVEQYPISKLRKMTKVPQYLHSLCFIYHRHQTFVDSLMVSFVHHAQILRVGGKEYADKEFFNHATKIVNKYPDLATFFRWFPRQESASSSQEEYYKNAYEILPKDDFEKFAAFFEGSDFDLKAAKWKYFEDSSRSLALYLRPIMLAINFEHYKPDNMVVPLLKLLKDHYLAGKTPGQLKLSDDLGLSLPQGMVPYLKTNKDDKHINPYRFEFFIYDKIYHHVNRGRMFCNDSVTYRDIDCDLVSDEMVDNVKGIAVNFGYSKIPIYCGQRLDDLLTELDETWEEVTNNIQSGANSGIKIDTDDEGKTTWRLTYDASSKLDDSFFRDVDKLDIADAFMFIDSQTNAFDKFEHIKARYVKRTKPLALAITACIISEAFGFGIKRMAEMSDINYPTLRTTNEDFIRVETLLKVNDQIANFISELPIYKAWNLMDDELLADIDGQKVKTKIDTIQSRFSKKYLGKGKGLSVLSLIANFIAVNVKNIGLNEYEGHHLYDMVYGHKSYVKIDAVTGDNHSMNKINFVALDVIDVDFVPSIKNIRGEADKLYSVKDPKEYSGLIRPSNKINKNRITKYSKDITKVLLSLILQENTQSTIIRKLNSHSRYAGLRAALYEYNNIFKSIHVLKMIDNMELRKAIRTARNRTEAYHQLQQLIRNMYHGIFKGKRIINHKVSTQAVRLVSNVVVAYNAIILNELYEKMIISNTDKNQIKKFLKISPMAWIHIAFTGRYTFNDDKSEIDLAPIIKVLEKELRNIGIKPLKKTA